MPPWKPHVISFKVLMIQTSNVAKLILPPPINLVRPSLACLLLGAYWSFLLL